MPTLLWRLVWAFLRPLSLPSVLQSLCAIVSAPWALPLCHGACVHLFQLTRPALYVLVLVSTCLGSPHSSSVLWCLCALVSAPWAFLPSASWVLCTLDSSHQPAMGLLCSAFHSPCTMSILYSAEVCMPPHSRMPGPSLVLWGFYGLLVSLSPPPGGGQSPRAVLELRSEAVSVFCPLTPCFAQFSKTPHLPLGPDCEKASLNRGTPLVSGLCPYLGAQAPIQKFSVFSLFMSLSSLLPHFRELSLSLWSPEIFCCGLEVAL